MPKRRAASAMGASPTWASQPTTASSRRRRRLVSAPGCAPRRRPPPLAILGAGAGAGHRSEGGDAVGGRERASSQATSSSRKAGGSGHGGVVEEAEHPGADGGERRDAERELDRPVVEPPHDLVLAHLVGHPARLERVDPDAHLNRGPRPRPPTARRAGPPRRRRPRGTSAPPGSPRVTSPSMRSTRKVRTAARSRSQATRYQCPKRNHSPTGATRRALAPVGEFRRGVRAHRLEELDQRRRRHHRRDRPDVTQAGRAQLQQRIAATRIAQVDAGDGEVERDLLVGLEIQVGQVERLAVDAGTRTARGPAAAPSGPGCPRRAGAACPARRPGAAPSAPAGSRGPGARWRRASAAGGCRAARGRGP